MKSLGLFNELYSLGCHVFILPCVEAECLTVAVTLSQSDTKALNPSPNTAPAVLKANTQ